MNRGPAPWRRLWPRSLGIRLSVALVLTLAIAQLGLTLVLNKGRDESFQGLIHGQAMTQTVTLARLLSLYPAADTDRLLRAFDSRQTCAEVTPAAPPLRPLDDREEELAEALAGMLHGIDSHAPAVLLDVLATGQRPCGPDYIGREDDEEPPDHDGDEDDRDGKRPAPRVDRLAALTMAVDLADGRWLTVRSAVFLPPEFDLTTLLTFLLSALAVAAVAIVVVRVQTRHLRHLAHASERFGRGETVPPLPVTGPSEVVAAISAFNVMQERLGTFLKERLQLLGSISHDLRTPLTTLRLKAEFIEDEAVRDDIIATIDELTTICEETLAFTRAEATNEETRVVDLAEIMRDMAAEFGLDGRDVRVSGEASLSLACRPVSLKRALRNLVQNAIRYGTTAEINIARTDGHALISIADNGPGIPPDRMDDAFRPFVRLEPSRSGETGGIGLGLPIARTIIGAHGGTLTLRNRPEGGLVAEVSLPTG